MLLRSSFWSAKKGHSVCVKTTCHMRGGTKLPKGWGGGGEMRGAALVKGFWGWGGRGGGGGGGGGGEMREAALVKEFWSWWLYC